MCERIYQKQIKNILNINKNTFYFSDSLFKIINCFYPNNFNTVYKIYQIILNSNNLTSKNNNLISNKLQINLNLNPQLNHYFHSIVESFQYIKKK